jgi:hypothetical protein
MALRDLLLVEQTMGAVQISDRNISPANTSKKGTFSRTGATFRSRSVANKMTSLLPKASAESGSPASAGFAVAGVRSSCLWSGAPQKTEAPEEYEPRREHGITCYYGAGDPLGKLIST